MRNAPVTLNTDCKVDLTELPIKVHVYAVPKLLWDNLYGAANLPMEIKGNVKILKTDLIHLHFIMETTTQ